MSLPKLPGFSDRDIAVLNNILAGIDTGKLNISYGTAAPADLNIGSMQVVDTGTTKRLYFKTAAGNLTFFEAGTGTSGYSGLSGYSGQSGASGTSGYSGANPGASGISGYSGFSGKSG